MKRKMYEKEDAMGFVTKTWLSALDKMNHKNYEGAYRQVL